MTAQAGVFKASVSEASSRRKHGKIYEFSAKRYQPEHEHCRCSVIPKRTKEVGTATDRGFDGADAWLLYRNRYFSEVKYFIEIHEVLKRDLDFPDYYSGTLDGLWDYLTEYTDLIL